MNIFKKLFGDKVSYDGEKVTAPEDKKRLGRQSIRVLNYMKRYKHTWRSLQEIAEDLNEPAPSVSAQLRNFRKDKFQPEGYTYEVHKKNISKGLWKYQLEIIEHNV